VVDAAISGVSAFVAPDGSVRAETRLFENVILRGTIVTSTVRTPYVRLGEWAVWLSLLIAMGVALTPRRRTAVRPAPGPLPDDPRTLVLLPTFDEAATIERVVRGLLARPERVDVLVIDDSSPDGTASIAEAIAAEEPRVRVKVRPSRSGLQSAYLMGFRQAIAEGYDLVVEMDSDLSHDPEQLSGLLAGAREHDLVIGSRYVPGGSVTNWSRVRLALSQGGNRYARLMLGLPIHDATSGYRVYRRALLQTLLERPIESQGYGFQIELALRAHLLGFDVAERPITFREREHGVSKLSRATVVEALWHVTGWGLRLRASGPDALVASD
jgi:dolichol-phosphate mannosyltransferase